MCQYRMTGRVLVPGVPHKPQGDSKLVVMSLNGGFLPKIATPWITRRQGERKFKKKIFYMIAKDTFGNIIS